MTAREDFLKKRIQVVEDRKEHIRRLAEPMLDKCYQQALCRVYGGHRDGNAEVWFTDMEYTSNYRDLQDVLDYMTALLAKDGIKLTRIPQNTSKLGLVLGWDNHVLPPLEGYALVRERAPMSSED